MYRTAAGRLESPAGGSNGKDSARMPRPCVAGLLLLLPMGALATTACSWKGPYPTEIEPDLRGSYTAIWHFAYADTSAASGAITCHGTLTIENQYPSGNFTGHYRLNASADCRSAANQLAGSILGSGRIRFGLLSNNGVPPNAYGALGCWGTERGGEYVGTHDGQRINAQVSDERLCNITDLGIGWYELTVAIEATRT